MRAGSIVAILLALAACGRQDPPPEPAADPGVAVTPPAVTVPKPVPAVQPATLGLRRDEDFAGRKPDRTFPLAGGLTLAIHYLNPGTRSEGTHGLLTGKDGKPVLPPKAGDLRLEDGTLLRHYGNRAEVAWAVTGWNYADKGRISKSWDR